MLTLYMMGGAWLAGLANESMVWGLGGAGAAIAFNFLAWRGVGLVPILALDAARAKRAVWWCGLANLLSLFLI